MNPFHPNDDELYFQIPSPNYYSLPIQTTTRDYEDQILHDPLIDATATGLLPCTNSQTVKGKKQKQLPAAATKTKDHENKKWMHRETEKQRRQEMSRLCSSFRSLLPFEYIKGKRSTSDHMHEGTKYIKHLENKVKQLQAKKDELMKLSNLSIHPETYVIVHPCSGGGVQIKCSYSFRKHDFPLSRMLHIVLKQGLNVVNCVSIKTDDHRFIHAIRSEDPHSMTEINYSELQRKLIAAISSSSLEETV
ncbi:Myc-type, basic helix-loop-helix [Sesbania bispinosa]|nr:Myc-type, basic helix-loop-helix [Sesbania bispinosa]